MLGRKLVSPKGPGGRAAAIVLTAVACWGCGGSGAKPPCSPDPLAAAFAAESALIERGRADADFAGALGSDGSQLLDAADTARAQSIQAAAAQLGVTLPTVGPATCPPAEITKRTGALSALVGLAFALAPPVLGLAIQGVPVNGMTPHVPMITTQNGTAADGSPTQIVTMNDVSFGGHDSTAVAMLTFSTSIMAGGKWTTEAVTANLSLNVCPDPGGLASGTVVFTVDGASGNGTTAASSYHAEINDTFAYVVNDAASVASQNHTSAFAYHATGARDADAVVHISATIGSDAHVQTTTPVVDEDDGSAESAALARQCLLEFGVLTAGMVESKATSKWREGTCVEVKVDPGSEMVDKSATIMVTARPRQKFEMADINAPVVATLSGVQSLSPANQPVAAPAMFTYVAGSKFKDQGVVSLKSTSKRGIGTGSATYTVKCDDTMMCPEGQRLNLMTCMCECAMMQDCPAGQTWDDQSCMCVCAPKPCLGGKTWDPRSCQCVCNLQCPPGKTLDPDLCECETTCQIDETTHAAPPTCMWVGTAHVSASEGGQVTKTMGDSVTWSMSYDASLAVTELDGAKPLNLSGSVTGDYSQVETITDGIKCTFTLTTLESVNAVVDQGTMQVFPLGDGTFMLYIDVGRNALFMGTFTDVASSPDCGDNSTDSVGLDFGSYYGMGPASGSTFSGSSADAGGSGVGLPNGDYVRYHLNWALRLVQR